MNSSARPFINGLPDFINIPLARFLPPLAPGMIGAWLKMEVPPGEWLIDPLGTTPILPLEAAREGYRILTVVNNPISAFILTMLAGGYQVTDFQSALADLSMIRHGEERLETHLQSLYNTRCSSCGQIIQADAFTWKREDLSPYSCIYQCPHCNDGGEHPITQYDIQRLSLIGHDHLHRSRALGLLKLSDEIPREIAMETLEAYLPRSLYFLLTLLNRIEASPMTEKNRQLLTALAIIACDEGNKLWSHPGTHNRPRTITIPSHYRENNLWKSLENAIQVWGSSPGSIPLTHYPDSPPVSGGICLYRGRLRTLLPLPGNINPQAIITVIPRPNQAFWSLSAIWSAWLWGYEALIPMKSALERRRYDWLWHVNAISRVLKIINNHLPTGIKTFFILPEQEPGLLSSTFIASKAAGLLFSGMASRSGQDTAQIHWVTGKYPVKQSDTSSRFIREAVVQYLTYTYEPSPYLHLHAASLANIDTESSFFNGPTETPESALKRVQSSFAQVFTDPFFLRKFHGQSREFESGVWWLAQDPPSVKQISLSDAIETEIIKRLAVSQKVIIHELETTLCSIFPGLFTPSFEFISTCLESYCDELKPQGTWILRHQEIEVYRQNDLQECQILLKMIGERFGFHVTGENPLLWRSENDIAEYSYHFTNTGIIGPIIFSPSINNSKYKVIVHPGSRSKLLAFKLQQDPRLAESVKDHWLFLKFRHLRQLEKRNDLDAQLWGAMFGKDPPSWEDATQIDLFAGI